MDKLFSSETDRPADAIALFDGDDLSQWTSGDGTPGWKIENGHMEVTPGSGSIWSKQRFTDVHLHVEFWLPHMPEATGQARANSGVYLQGRYEVQVLDSYGLDPQDDDCGGIYKLCKPMVNACRPPKTWQTYDILFRAPRFNEHNVKTENARISILHNGVWIHSRLEVPQPTGGQLDDNVSEPGPVMLQDHGDLVRFRNIWVRELSL